MPLTYDDNDGGMTPRTSPLTSPQGLPLVREQEGRSFIVTCTRSFMRPLAAGGIEPMRLNLSFPSRQLVQSGGSPQKGTWWSVPFF